MEQQCSIKLAWKTSSHGIMCFSICSPWSSVWGGGRDFSRAEISRKKSPTGAAPLVVHLSLLVRKQVRKPPATPATVATALSPPCLPGQDELYPQTAIHTISFLLVLLVIGI